MPSAQIDVLVRTSESSVSERRVCSTNPFVASMSTFFQSYFLLADDSQARLQNYQLNILLVFVDGFVKEAAQ